MNKIRRAHEREHREINRRLDMVEFKLKILDKHSDTLLELVKDIIKALKNEDKRKSDN